jgi:hypothetical protein
MSPDHYQGDEAYANYGYLPLDGIWVDPDSEGEIAAAMKNSGKHVRLPKIRDDYNSYPGMTQEDNIAATNRTESDPPVLPIYYRNDPEMTEDDLYRGFIEEVTDEIDGDGDPRLNYITPATFARWAEGAAEGNHYVPKSSIERSTVSQNFGSLSLLASK